MSYRRLQSHPGMGGGREGRMLDKQADRLPDRQADRQIDRQVYRQTGRQTLQTGRQAGRYLYYSTSTEIEPSDLTNVFCQSVNIKNVRLMQRFELESTARELILLSAGNYFIKGMIK